MFNTVFSMLMLLNMRPETYSGSSGSVDLGTAECYDPKLEKWTPIKPLIRARSHNGKIYCHVAVCVFDHR